VAEKEPVVNKYCPRCGEPVNEPRLHVCQMCRKVFCPSCAVTGYGREFCGVHCRDMFFFGDGDESEKDF
jgi:hypothetical protein